MTPIRASLQACLCRQGRPAFAVKAGWCLPICSPALEEAGFRFAYL
ncbi:hypothetical protein [Algoriphagus litoralis]|nr:hypothetical protein [Algoriphagus litoralis]